MPQRQAMFLIGVMWLTACSSSPVVSTSTNHTAHVEISYDIVAASAIEAIKETGLLIRDQDIGDVRASIMTTSRGGATVNVEIEMMLVNLTYIKVICSGRDYSHHLADAVVDRILSHARARVANSLMNPTG